MCNDILISLHPRHSANVLAGTKTAELRRRPVRVSPGTRVWIYTTLPEGRVEALAVVEEVCEGSHAMLWNRFESQLAISRGDFDDYMTGATNGCAIVLGSVVRLRKPIGLDDLRRLIRAFQPPQFFKRLGPDSEELAVFSSLQGSRGLCARKSHSRK
jgi:predicted transcriptional regulator